MPTLRIEPDQLDIPIEKDETILTASLKSGIPHVHACGGNALCSTCRVVVKKGANLLSERNEAETTLFKQLQFTHDVRLACQTKVSKKGIIIVKRPVIDEIDLQITNALGQESVSTLKKIGEARDLAIMFTDIVSYTPFAEALPPYDIIHVLNRYFFLMGRVVTKYKGNIIDYYGDGILAVFGMYADSAQERVQLAVDAGKEMQAELTKLNPYLKKMYGKTFKIRIGVNYGNIVTGSVGIDSMQKFAVIGDAVNMASRIETANKVFGTNFLISESVKNLLPPKVKLGRCFEAALKGKKGNYTLYEVLT